MTSARSAPTTEIHKAACDQAALATLVADLGAAAVAELVALFIGETRARLRRIADPACTASHLLREVHTLRGGASIVAAARLEALANALEARLRHGGAASLAEIAALRGAFDAYVDAAMDAARGITVRMEAVTS
jgi:HPt (histidine-containing phosphotransfer) domain-containing protein